MCAHQNKRNYKETKTGGNVVGMRFRNTKSIFGIPPKSHFCEEAEIFFALSSVIKLKVTVQIPCWLK